MSTQSWRDDLTDEQHSGPSPRSQPRGRRWPAVDVDRALIEREVLHAEVRHHWVAFAPWVLLVAALLVLLLVVIALAPLDVLWAPALVLLLVLGWATDHLAATWRDRFLITDSRLVRVSGVLSRKVAWMPLERVLDITVLRPWWLRPLGAGHLVLENAAQEQGLRDVRYIPRPTQYAHHIHRLRTGGEDVPPRPSPHATGASTTMRAPHQPTKPPPVRPWRDAH